MLTFFGFASFLCFVFISFGLPRRDMMGMCMLISQTLCPLTGFSLRETLPCAVPCRRRSIAALMGSKSPRKIGRAGPDLFQLVTEAEELTTPQFCQLPFFLCSFLLVRPDEI